jgi:hypothetical protein
MPCPKCQFENIPDARFCQGCGIEFTTLKAAKAPRAAKWFVIIAVCLFLGYCVVSVVRFYRFLTTPSGQSQIVLMREAMPAPEAPPKPDGPERQIVIRREKYIAETSLQQALKEIGCQQCRVVMKGQIVSIAHPDLAPEMTVARVLTKTVTAKLREDGFTKVHVYQGTNFEGKPFDYPLQ